MSTQTSNTKALDSLKNILTTTSQYGIGVSVDEHNIDNQLQSFYQDLQATPYPQLHLNSLVQQFAQKLNIDLNDNRIQVQFATIDNTFANASLDGLIESVNKKLEFIEDMSYTIQNNNIKSTEADNNIKPTEAENTLTDNDNNEKPKRTPFTYLKQSFNYSKEVAGHIKDFIVKQANKAIKFLPTLNKFKTKGHQVFTALLDNAKQIQSKDEFDLFMEQLDKVDELQLSNININNATIDKINDPEFNNELLLTQLLNNAEQEKIKDDAVSIEDNNIADIESINKTENQEKTNNDAVSIEHTNIKDTEATNKKEEKDIITIDKEYGMIYKKDTDGKCFSALNHHGQPWNGMYREIPIEEYNEFIENSISNAYSKISNVKQNVKGDIIGVDENFVLYSEDAHGNKICGQRYCKDAYSGKYTVGFDYKGGQMGNRQLSEEEYHKALAEYLSLENEAVADYLQNSNLSDLVNNFNKEQIEKEELTKEDVIKEDVIKEDVETPNLNTEDNLNTFDCYSVDSFTVKQGNTMNKYFKNEKGEMFRTFVFNGLEGAAKPVENSLDWENAIKESVEYSHEFKDIGIDEKDIDMQSIELDSKIHNKDVVEYEDYYGI